MIKLRIEDTTSGKVIEREGVIIHGYIADKDRAGQVYIVGDATQRQLLSGIARMTEDLARQIAKDSEVDPDAARAVCKDLIGKYLEQFAKEKEEGRKNGI